MKVQSPLRICGKIVKFLKNVKKLQEMKEMEDRRNDEVFVRDLSFDKMR